MTHADFVHLRVHSAYSLSEGALRIKQLTELCRSEAMPAVAVTDRANLFGALEFCSAACAAGVQPIVGCQLSIAQSEPRRQNGAPPPPDQLVLLVQNEVGYRNLLHLVSKAYLDSEPGGSAELPLEALKGWTEGLIALTAGCRGAVGRFLLEQRGEWAEGMLLNLARLFPGRCYVELQRHGLRDEQAIESELIDLAFKHDLPLVATNGVYFANEAMYEAHDALLCIAEGSYVGQQDRRRLTPEHRFKTAPEMAALFEDLPEAIANSVVIARRCAYFPRPVAPILPAYQTVGGRSEAEELAEQAKVGLERRLARRPADERAARPDEAYWKRLDYELGVIEQMGFPGYFLIVADFIKWAKDQGIPVGPGRGSGAASVVAWSLTITDLDPLRWGLVFERFLNPERISMPDFDIDFCQDRRDEVIRYVQEKYGTDRVAQIITFGKLQARAALRDVGRVLQMPYPQVDRICKLVPNNPANPVTLQQAIDGEPMLQEMRGQDEQVGRLIDIALKLEGLYRHASTHAAGVVIGDRPLEQLIPLYRDPRSDMPVTQFNMKFVEQAGLVKFDFLGLKTLTVLVRALDLIKERDPASGLDLETIPLDDQKTFDMLARADTVGVFQLESSGMRDVLRKLKADHFEEIIAVVALYRPGPMDNIPSYIERKHGREQPDYLYPSLEGILNETYGIMIYQEQVLQIAQELSGFSLGNADLLRRAMGKKIKAEMDAQRAAFTEGAVARGVPEAKAAAIFDQVNKFAGYGFNKAHAAAYALVAYQTAYLKANYPVEFLAASMTYDMGNTDKLNVFRQELDRLGIPLLPPDVNASRRDFRVEALPDGRLAIRYALAAIRNVGGAAMDNLAEERAAGGRFRDLPDFVRRLDHRAINKRQIENLAAAGALDGLNRNRRQSFEGAESIIRHAAAAAAERDSAQENLFGGDPSAEGSLTLALPEVGDWPDMERLRQEFDAIGFYLSDHPLNAYAAVLERLKVVTASSLTEAVLRDRVQHKLAGVVIGRQERTSRQGNRFAFVQLSDTSGMFEVMVFSELLSAKRDVLESGGPLLITVNADLRNDEAPRMTAQAIEPLDRAAEQSSAGLKVIIGDSKPLESLKSILERGAGSPAKGRVSLVLDLEGSREVEIELPETYRVSAELRQAIKAIPGVAVQDR